MIGPMLARADAVIGLEPCAKSVLTRLCIDADNRRSDESTLSARSLAALTGFSERGVRRALSMLQGAGHILRVGEAGDNVWHTIVGPMPAPGTPRRGLPKCQLSAPKRRRIMERDGYRCRHCGGHRELSIDHIVPRVAGGSNDDDNLQVLCVPCNSKKGVTLP